MAPRLSDEITRSIDREERLRRLEAGTGMDPTGFPTWVKHSRAIFEWLCLGGGILPKYGFSAQAEYLWTQEQKNTNEVFIRNVRNLRMRIGVMPGLVRRRWSDNSWRVGGMLNASGNDISLFRPDLESQPKYLRYLVGHDNFGNSQIGRRITHTIPIMAKPPGSGTRGQNYVEIIQLYPILDAGDPFGSPSAAGGKVTTYAGPGLGYAHTNDPYGVWGVKGIFYYDMERQYGYLQLPEHAVGADFRYWNDPPLPPVPPFVNIWYPGGAINGVGYFFLSEEGSPLCFWGAVPPREYMAIGAASTYPEHTFPTPEWQPGQDEFSRGVGMGSNGPSEDMIWENLNGEAEFFQDKQFLPATTNTNLFGTVVQEQPEGEYFSTVNWLNEVNQGWKAGDSVKGYKFKEAEWWPLYSGIQTSDAMMTIRNGWVYLKGSYDVALPPNYYYSNAFQSPDTNYAPSDYRQSGPATQELRFLATTSNAEGSIGHTIQIVIRRSYNLDRGWWADVIAGDKVARRVRLDGIAWQIAEPGTYPD